MKDNGLSFTIQEDAIIKVKGEEPMKFESMQIKKNNRLALDYMNKSAMVEQYFHYHPFGDDEKRLAHINQRTYQRSELTENLLQQNKAWGAGEATLSQIKRLQEPDSTVVVGGQQAGILTGPLYTVNKVISILKLAKRKEEALQRPVLPVFWIAGEDHDFAEINHIFSIRDYRTHKHTIHQHADTGKSVSDIEIDKDAAKKWLRQFLNDLPETQYSAEWLGETLQSLEQSRTYTDFFARLIFRLFPDEGLILIDAHDRELRKLERDYFQLLVSHQREISANVYETMQCLQQEGYPAALEVEQNCANLFYHDDRQERVLLERRDESWAGKNDEVLKTTEEMQIITQERPWCLSTNVVTRPIMQELLFPTLAFVAGDGEISYWATLKKAFETLGLEVPPVVPRLSITYLTERTVKLLWKRVLEPAEVIQNGTAEVKQRWLRAQQTVPVDTMFDEAKRSMNDIHKPLRDYAASVGPDLAGEAEKNMLYIERQMDNLQKRMSQKLKATYQVPLNHFDELESALHPNGGLQERVWNPYLLINQYGQKFLKEIIHDENMNFGEEHYIVYLEQI